MYFRLTMELPVKIKGNSEIIATSYQYLIFELLSNNNLSLSSSMKKRYTEILNLDEDNISQFTHFKELPLTFDKNTLIKIKSLIQYNKGGVVQNETIFSRMQYFSFITASTIGYGDIVPVSNYARFLTVIQSLISFILTGLLIHIITMHSKNEYRNLNFLRLSSGGSEEKLKTFYQYLQKRIELIFTFFCMDLNNI